MNSDNKVAVDGAESASENGVTKELVITVDNGVASKTLNGSTNEVVEITGENANSRSHSNLDDFRPFARVTEETHLVEIDGLIASRETQVEDADKPKHITSQKVQSKVKSGKPLGGKNTSLTLVKKTKDGKNAEDKVAVLNGSVGPKSHSKESLKSRSSNDTEPHVTKPGKSYAAPAEGIGEKTILTDLKKVSHEKHEGDTLTSTSPKESDSEARRISALPNYGFSFKCDERAEKRKEFYSKLEEKTHAKEQEKSNLQAKSKETQEAELKMLRRSLNFKATPMPNFYQEPQPPKVELKKIPPTRPKSPKLGRKKTVPTVSSDEDTSQVSSPGRLSLDQKVSNCSQVGRGTSPVDSKKPQLKLLPGFPSQKTTLSNGKKETKTAPTKAAASVKSKTERKKTEKDGGAANDSNPANETAITISSSSYQESVSANEPSCEAERNASESFGSEQQGKSPEASEPVAVEH